MPSFVDVFVSEQRLQKIMVWKDLIFFLAILLLATCQGLRKTFLFIYFFVIFIFLFQSSNILSQEDYCQKYIVIRIFLSLIFFRVLVINYLVL